MLRSLFSGISGLRSHQTMLDVTGNNIANVNTTGFKSSQTQFQDTLSQMLQNGGGAQDGVGGTNPAQVGLGVRVAGITTNFTQGASQMTGRSTDMMIQGDGFFVVRKGAESYYTRAGSFDFDSTGQMVLPGEGALVQGWAAVNGVVDTNGPLSDLRVPAGTLMPAVATSTASYEGNLDAAAANGTILNRTIDVYDATGNVRELQLTFTKAAAGWSVAATDGTATVVAAPMTFAADGSLTTPTTLTVGGVAVDISDLTGFAGIDSVKARTQNGQAAGTLQSFALGADGTITGAFSNGLKQTIGRLAIGSFTNPSGLEKAGGSLFRTSVNSGDPQVGPAGTGGRGTLAGGALEMSNVDLSSEFTSLIIAQRGFQANSRVITTSDEVLQELVNLKR
ncbi:flagellar hook protein FlgE [Cellulomonas fimi]|uniref:Flagellar hook protein FlgE n=1 Tax=Cellulomonas fimi (strain ATCC 484 / DSM 20113 / JCM 1341 / CCUG 24087 / LMG 16345 / NBRC 15513 / NCIMB 8980 / NCTC 7547 / NRS-133) TaxID=590998 RepID=F4GYV0_CELFA|nr:flagellar hook protein FlgE [Cellulomonas fimi]AEE44819.1 flagellar hook-basal body protein [Cellulomonas fimi ATCC 484]NNH08365.1 flagellar hook protein FlgE [Cellulomonas fimi]VEH27383.1 Flagellar hook protein flgE [Cellulomonas fimi]